jgi:hypothetical protein
MSEAALKGLVRDGLTRLGISRNKLLQRMGYANLQKGRRRLQEIEAGNLRVARLLQDRLAAGLDLPIETVIAMIEAERTSQARAEDAAYRTAFRPHAVLITERTRPSSIAMAGITGAHRFLILEFPEGLSPEGRVANILGKLPEGVPFWGRVTGFVVNHSPDFATRHELDGSPVEELDRAMRVGVPIASI